MRGHAKTKTTAGSELAVLPVDLQWRYYLAGYQQAVEDADGDVGAGVSKSACRRAFQDFVPATHEYWLEE